MRFIPVEGADFLSDSIKKRIGKELMEHTRLGEPGMLVVDCPYAKYVEYGTEPATPGSSEEKRFRKNIENWVEVSLGIGREDPDFVGTVTRICTKIMHEGVEPKPFIRPAIYNGLELWKREVLGKELDRPMDRLGQIIVGLARQKLVDDGTLSTGKLHDSIRWVNRANDSITMEFGGKDYDARSPAPYTSGFVGDRTEESFGKGTGMVIVWNEDAEHSLVGWRSMRRSGHKRASMSMNMNDIRDRNDLVNDALRSRGKKQTISPRSKGRVSREAILSSKDDAVRARVEALEKRDRDAIATHKRRVTRYRKKNQPEPNPVQSVRIAMDRQQLRGPNLTTSTRKPRGSSNTSNTRTTRNTRNTNRSR